MAYKSGLFKTGIFRDLRGERELFEGFNSFKAVILASAVLFFAASPRQLCFALSVKICDDVYDPLTLDPHKQFSEKNHTLLQQIYEGLVRFKPDGGIEPALAVSWERVSPERMRFNLRHGVYFHNGEPFDSGSVVYSIKRYLDPSTGFPAASFIESIMDAIAVDPDTVEIVTKYPDGLLLNRLAAFVLIVPSRYSSSDGGEGLLKKPAGTGPFKFESWEKGRKIVLSANRKYWMPGLPGIDELTFMFMPEKEQLEGILSGALDLVTELPGTATMLLRKNSGTTVLKSPTLYAMAGAFNLGSGPLSDIRVREAIDLAVNRDEIIRYDLLGNGRPLATTSMQGEGGYDSGLKVYAYDPGRARALLKEAGYPAGFRLKVASKRQGERTMKIISRELKAIGVDIETSFFPDSELPKALKTGKWDMVFGGCPDPMAHAYFIQSIFLNSNSPYSLGKNPEYDGLSAAMTSTTDPGEMEKKAKEIDRILYDKHLLLPVYQRIKTYGMKKGLTFVPYVTGMPHLFNLKLETADEKRK